jgi:uncharacterized protein (DUF1697 family)
MMAAFVSFVRAINVGGRNRLAMSDLRAAHEAIGCTTVSTLLQSGNAVFTSSKTAAALEKAIAKQLIAKHDLDVVVVVRSAKELAAAIDANPFPAQAQKEPSAFVVMFLTNAPSRDAIKEFEGINVGPEKKTVKGREAYIHYGAGMGTSKLTNALIERVLGARGTARNWNTVTKLLALTDAPKAR